MKTTRRVRVWVSPISYAFKVEVDGLVLKVMPNAVFAEEKLVVVGEKANWLYSALLNHNYRAAIGILDQLLPTIQFLLS